MIFTILFLFQKNFFFNSQLDPYFSEVLFFKGIYTQLIAQYIICDFPILTLDFTLANTVQETEENREMRTTVTALGLDG